MMGQEGFDQRDQEVQGPQTNVGGNVRDVFSGEFHGDVIVDSSRASISFPVPFQIPLPPQDLTGREDVLSEIVGLFERDRVIVGLRGLGGVGKTALAFALAERLRDRFPDGQIFVSMQGTSQQPLSSAEAMSQVIRSYRPALRLPENEAELANLYRSVLEGKRALLLLDNALDYSQVRPLLPPAECSLIVTSRRKFKISGMILKDLDVLKLEKAVDLLLSTAREDHLIGVPEEKSAWEDLARLCGCLPVALRAAGSFLANTPDSSPEQYARQLQDEKRRLERIGKEGVEEDLNLKLSLSYHRLEPETARVFRELSVFPSDFDAKAEEVICRDDGHGHLSELVRWSLVDYKYLGKDYGRYKLHDLVRLFASARQLGEPCQSIQELYATYFKDLLFAANSFYKNGGSNIHTGLALFDHDEANIKAGHAWAKKNQESNSSAAELCISYPDAGTYVLDLRLNLNEKINWLETGVTAARLQNDKRREGIHLGNLGRAYALLGAINVSIHYYVQALAIAREIKDKKNIGTWLGNLGWAYSLRGETRKAIRYYNKALKIARERGNKRNESTNLGNLGEAYSALGEKRRAIFYLYQALTIAQESGDKRIEGNWLGSLGVIYTDLGEIKKSIDYLEKAAVIANDLGDFRGEETRRGNLGRAYAALGETRKAISYFDQALTIARNIGDKWNEGIWLENLGIAYYRLGDKRKAINCYKQQLQIAQEIGDLSGKGNALWNMSLALYEVNKCSEAIRKAEESLEIYEQIDSPIASRVRQHLAEWRK